MSKVITKIEAQKKTKNRVNVYINDEFAFGCSAELIYYHNLSKGKEIEPEELEEIIDEDNFISGKSLGLKYVESSLKTVFQVKEYLIKKEFSESVADRVIDFLKGYGFLNDEYYTNAYVKQYIGSQGKGNIKYKLQQKGISKEIIDNTLKDISYEDEERAALKLAGKRAAILCGKENDIRKIKSKLSTFLVSKGYNFEIINSVLGQLQLEEMLAASRAEVQEEDQEEAFDRRMEELMDIARKRYERLSNSEKDPFKLKRKLQDFLLRKGYNYDEIKTVTTSLVGE